MYQIFTKYLLSTTITKVIPKVLWDRTYCPSCECIILTIAAYGKITSIGDSITQLMDQKFGKYILSHIR